MFHKWFFCFTPLVLSPHALLEGLEIRKNVLNFTSYFLPFLLYYWFKASFSMPHFTTVQWCLCNGSLNWCYASTPRPWDRLPRAELTSQVNYSEWWPNFEVDYYLELNYFSFSAETMQVQATDMYGAAQPDFFKSETAWGIKIIITHHLYIFKRCVFTPN